jgi:hypothetical protein
MRNASAEPRDFSGAYSQAVFASAEYGLCPIPPYGAVEPAAPFTARQAFGVPCSFS